MKLCKFGGSSLANAKQFEKVKNIITSDPERKIIVVSAPGKGKKEDNKITDLLYLTFSHIKYRFDYHPIFDQVKARYLEIQSELHIDNVDLNAEFERIENRIKEGISEEELVSRGEYLSAKLLSAYLGYEFADSTNFIKFNYDGKILEKESYEAMHHYSLPNNGVVVPGFYGVYPNGKICLFSRGGSDVTGSYLAVGFEADLYENWTDVCGILMTDPRIVKNPRKISYVTYDELRELSYSGASVLHEDAILPLEENPENPIPLQILNTNDPEDSGTMILDEVKDEEEKNYLITGITGKKNFYAFTFYKEKSISKMNAIIAVLEVFQKYNVPVEHIPTAIDSFSIVVEYAKMDEKYYDIISDLNELEGIESFDDDEDVALIAIVGRNMAGRPGTFGKLLSVLGKQKINCKVLDQGRDELNIIVGIANKDFELAIQSLYDKFAFTEI